MRDLDYYKWHKSLSRNSINNRSHKWILNKINSSLLILKSIKKKVFKIMI